MNQPVDWREQTLRQEVYERIQNDKRTTPDTFLGWNKSTIFKEVIKFGQADFDAPLGHLNGADKALLYAMYNQSGHLRELDEAFGQLLADQQKLSSPFVFDIGCGPFTAGLSLAIALGNQQIFRYYGIDLYASMRDLGAKIACTAKTHNGLHPLTECTFHQTLDEIEYPPAARNNAKIFIASYLLASDTLIVEPMVKSIAAIADGFSRGPSLLLYTNTSNPLAGQKYPELKKCLEDAGFQCTADDNTTLEHRNKPRDLHYALFFKAASYEG